MGRGTLVSQAKGWDPLVAQAAPCVCFSAVALLHNKGSRHRRMIWANSLWLCYYYTQSSPSKNKNINYILIHQRILIVCPAVQYTTVWVRQQNIIIIMSCRQHGYPWPSLATSPNRSSPLAGLQGYIPYPHIAAVCMFVLVVLLLPGHMCGSIGVH